MATISLKNRLKTLEVHNEIKKELPWDCKNLMRRHNEESAEQEIIFKFAKIKGGPCGPPGPHRLAVDDTRGLSPEAREFLSLSAERQAHAVKYYCPPKQYTQEEGNEMRREILERLSKIREGQRAPII
jgi:hypothetical protein